MDIIEDRIDTLPTICKRMYVPGPSSTRVYRYRTVGPKGPTESFRFFSSESGSFEFGNCTDEMGKAMC